MMMKRMTLMQNFFKLFTNPDLATSEVSKKQKSSKNSNMLPNCAVFQPKLSKVRKTLQNVQNLQKKPTIFSKFIQIRLNNSAI